jgi:uncharacterized protein
VTVAGLVVAAGAPPLLAWWSGRVFGPSPRLHTQVGLQIALCAIAAIVFVIVRRGEQLPIASIGARRPTWQSAVSAAGVVVVAWYGLPLLTAPLMNALDVGDFQPGLHAIAGQPVWWRVCVALSSGVVEELLYRGYAVERLATLTGRLSWGGAIATVAFGMAHVPFWGPGPALAADLPFGAIMVAFYVWRRDLFANAAAHTTLLLIGMLSVPSIASDH